jgi:hypothetical protein
MSAESPVPEELPVGFISVDLVNAALTLHGKVKDSAKWSIGGDTADAMRGAKVKPDHLEIITDSDGATKIYEAMKEYGPVAMGVREQKLLREAVIADKSYPVQIRSNYTEFQIGNVVVKVHGDLQYKVGEWRWGDALEFWPEPLSLVGTMVSLVPLTLRLQIYSSLGWVDKVDAINAAIEKTRGHHEFAGELG